MLLSIQKRDVSSYQRQALIDNKQGHVVTRFLPEIQTTQPKPESPETQQEKKGKASVNKFANKVTENRSMWIKSCIYTDIKDMHRLF